MRENGPTIGVLTNATPAEIDVSTNRGNMTVFVRPQAGDSVSVTYTVDRVNWENWPAGSVTAYTVDVLDAPVLALRFTRTSGSGTTSTYGVL